MAWARTGIGSRSGRWCSVYRVAVCPSAWYWICRFGSRTVATSSRVTRVLGDGLGFQPEICPMIGALPPTVETATVWLNGSRSYQYGMHCCRIWRLKDAMGYTCPLQNHRTQDGGRPHRPPGIREPAQPPLA